VDLNAPGDAALDIIRAARALNPPPRTVGFCSHTNTARIRAAREAGADEVMANSALDSKLSALMDALAE
jgi:DNA-binding NarL/FixJ family response regulator